MKLLPRRRRTGLSPLARKSRPLAVEALERRVVMSTITVTSLADSGAGSLREAITMANADPSPDTIQFASSVEGQITLLSALPNLSSSLILDGPGASILNVARSSDPSTAWFRILTVDKGASVTMTGLTISGGLANGGGIFNSGTLTITDSVIRNNQSLAIGGGVTNVGRLTIVSSQIRDNQASIGAGGISSDGGSLFMLNCEITGNLTKGTGGGLANVGTASIWNSVISGNSALNGDAGGIFNAGSCIITGCTIANNSTTGLGGGIENANDLTLTNVTITGNSASAGGGGMTVDRPATVIGSTIADNISDSSGIYVRSELTLQTSILDNPAGKNIVIAKDPGPPPGQFTSLGHNLFSDTPDTTLDPTDLVSTDPLLASLADNGGPTPTMALLPGSPAIDAGVTVDGITTDQRGVPRPQGTAPDIGAFESQGFLFTISAGDGQSATVGTAFTDPLVVTVSTSDGHPLAGAVVEFGAPTNGASAILISASATTDANGHASVTAIANGEAGSYSVTTQAGGVKGPAFTLTNVAAPPPVLPTPTVVSVQRFGVHLQPTFIAVRFSEPMDAGRAENLGNYRLVSAGRDRKLGTRDDRTIRLRSVQYDPTTQSIRLSPSIRLPLRLTYQLTINGTPPDGLASTDGIFLGGAGASQPGTNYVATIDRGSLLLPATSRIMKRERMRQRFQEHHPRPSSFANGGEFR